MRITYDVTKRDLTLKERRLDFRHADQVFEGEVFEVEDDRKDYGEPRFQTIGRLGRKIVMVVWTPRGDARRIISMRKCNADEKATYHLYVGGSG